MSTTTGARHDPHRLQASVEPGTVVVASTGDTPFSQVIMNGRHMLPADEPASAGGGDRGPSPYELLLMSLGACTSMTVHMYAAHKQWPLEQVVVRLRHSRVHAEDCANCEDPKTMISRIDKTLEFVGPLDEAQRTRLAEIADHCPVHKTLTSKIEIKTTLVAA